MRTTAAMTIGARARAIDFVALAKPRLNLLVVASTVAGYAMAHGDTTNAGRTRLDHCRHRPRRGRGVRHQPGHRARRRQPDAPDPAPAAARRPARPGRSARLRGHPLRPRPAGAGGRRQRRSAPSSHWPRSSATPRSTRRLKRRTSFATVIGAIPGALPPVIGWAAAEGTLSQGAWVLFGDPLPLATAALPRHRLDVPRGLCPRRLPDAAGDRARRPQHRRVRPSSTPPRCCRWHSRRRWSGCRAPSTSPAPSSSP